MPLDEISEFIERQLATSHADVVSVASRLPGGAPQLVALRGGRRWPDDDNRDLSEALEVGPAEVAEAVARQRRSHLWTGIHPPDDAARELDRRLLAWHTHTLAEATDAVMNDVELAASAPRAAYVSCTPLGAVQVPLGVLLAVWREGRWHAECPACGSLGRVTSSVGSALSGMGSTRGVCTSCHRFGPLRAYEGITRDTVDVLRRTREWLAPERAAWIDGRRASPWPQGSLPLDAALIRLGVQL